MLQVMRLEKIRRIVEELGLSEIVTAAQARKKWTNLIQKYKAIKGGCSTSNEDWPYFQILDTVVPLMRKETIEKGTAASSSKEWAETVLQIDNSAKPDSESLYSDTRDFSASLKVETVEKCESDAIEDEPPQKKQRRRQAAQKARERWWGAVEDEVEEDASNHMTTKVGSSKNIDPTEMEFQTFQMLKSCSNSLSEIRELLKSHTQAQQDMMTTLTQAVTQQSDALKNLVFTITTQNSAIVALSARMSAEGSQSSTGIPSERSYKRSQSHSQEHQENPLLTAQQNLMSALSHDAQDCDTSLVDNSELSDSITGL